ncbi:MAG: Tat proofreading chaperone DmsD [Coriobacteriia bacterium]|nr:Tat proofreading chaperone DmsD [Coriobacteriia bacterium]MCL2750450.1 Tat proofreading chaperone DmsD [Coriobacteriia bacterium]
MAAINREEVIDTSKILGGLYCLDPRDTEGWELISSLANTSLIAEWPFGKVAELTHISKLLQEGIATDRQALIREYQRLFIGPKHFNAPAWGSVYLDRDSVLFGSSTIALRQWMRTNGITLNEGERVPADHIGKMLLLLGWLAEEKPDLVPEYLAEHLMPWAPRYLELLEGDAENPFYEGLALLTRVSLESICLDLEVVPVKKQLFF